MSVALLDINVLIALAWPNHLHHQFASDWIAANWRNGWATCPMTQCGFVRISSNPRLSTASATPAIATRLLSAIVSLPGHVFWVEDLNLSDAVQSLGIPLLGHQQITDAYLIALALHRGGRFTTFDKGAALLQKSTTGAVELITP